MKQIVFILLAVFTVLFPLTASAGTPVQGLCNGGVTIICGYGHVYFTNDTHACDYESINDTYQSEIANLHGDPHWNDQMRHKAAVSRNRAMACAYQEVPCDGLGGYYHQFVTEYIGQYQCRLLVFDQNGLLKSDELIADPDNLDDYNVNNSGHVFRGCAPSSCPPVTRQNCPRNNVLQVAGAFLAGVVIEHQSDDDHHRDFRNFGNHFFGRRHR